MPAIRVYARVSPKQKIRIVEALQLFTIGLFSNPALLAAVLITTGLQLCVICLPPLQGVFKTSALSLQELGICCALASLVFVAVEIEKLLVRRWGLYQTKP